MSISERESKMNHHIPLFTRTDANVYSYILRHLFEKSFT
jgi:hypothetical protein